MKNIIRTSLAVIACLSVQGVAYAADVVVTSGRSGGGYNTIGNRLSTVLAEQGLQTEVVTSVGSLENLNRLSDPENPANVGMTQADALRYFLIQNPGFAEKFMILGDIGKECVFIITGEDSRIEDDGDLQDESGDLIAVQDPNSGVAVTYEYMTILEPKFKNTAPAFVDGMEALLAMKSGGGNSKIKAVMLVQRASARSDEMKVILESPDEYRFVPVKDWDLNDKLPDGSAVYTFEDVLIEKVDWGFDTKVDTICTRGLMIAAKDKLTPDQRSRLARVMLLASSRVLGE